jgi:hypothetical protein
MSASACVWAQANSNLGFNLVAAAGMCAHANVMRFKPRRMCKSTSPGRRFSAVNKDSTEILNKAQLAAAAQVPATAYDTGVCIIIAHHATVSNDLFFSVKRYCM